MPRIPVAAVVLVLLSPSAAGAELERHVQVAPGQRLRVVDAGRGDAVVLIPGLFGSAYGFRKLVGPLVEHGHRVLVIEPLGVGGSDRPGYADYSLTAQADRVATALDALGVDSGVIVAHAVAASVALRLACRHPERVRAIVSLDGGPAEAAATPGFRRAMRFSSVLKLFGGVARIRRTVRRTLIERSADPTWVTDEVVSGYMAAAERDLDGTLRAFRGMARASEPERLAPRLAELRCPVRIVIGETPRLGGISEAELALLAERLGRFAIDRVPQAGHFVFEEAPLAVVASVENALGCRSPGRAAVASR